MRVSSSLRCPGLESSGRWLPLAGDSAAAVAVPTARPNAAAQVLPQAFGWSHVEAQMCLGTGSLRIYSWRAQPALKINAHRLSHVLPGGGRWPCFFRARGRRS